MTTKLVGKRFIRLLARDDPSCGEMTLEFCKCSFPNRTIFVDA